MSFFSIFSGAAGSYSNERHYISRDEFTRFFQNNRWSSITREEETLILNALISARDSQGKISPRRAYETLKGLRNKNQISYNDLQIMARDLGDYLNQKFSD